MVATNNTYQLSSGEVPIRWYDDGTTNAILPIPPFAGRDFRDMGLRRQVREEATLAAIKAYPRFVRDYQAQVFVGADDPGTREDFKDDTDDMIDLVLAAEVTWTDLTNGVDSCRLQFEEEDRGLWIRRSPRNEWFTNYGVVPKKPGQFWTPDTFCSTPQSVHPNQLIENDLDREYVLLLADQQRMYEIGRPGDDPIWGQVTASGGTVKSLSTVMGAYVSSVTDDLGKTLFAKNLMLHYLNMVADHTLGSPRRRRRELVQQ